MLQATTLEVEPEDSDDDGGGVQTRTTPVPGRRRYGAGNLRNKTPPPPSTPTSTTATTQLSVNFDLASSVADSDTRPSADQSRHRFNRRTTTVLARGKSASSSYHMQPRRSLLGKPINYRAHRRDVKYRRLQNRIYNFLERPKDYPSISYHLIVYVIRLL